MVRGQARIRSCGAAKQRSGVLQAGVASNSGRDGLRTGDGTERVGEEYERVVLVDESDREIGSAGKLEVHRAPGRLHRAFSAFLFDDRRRMLIQRRASGKYHFPDLWTNACCGHPRPGEDVESAVHRRIHEELGARVELKAAFHFVYEVTDAISGLIEREFDHVYVGRVLGAVDPCPSEVGAVAWWGCAALIEDVGERSERYTPWFRTALVELDRRRLLPR